MKKVPPKDLAEQFMKDLSNADNLSQIKWIFNGSKNPVDFREKRIEAHICICFIAYKVYKELERIIKLAKIDISVDSVLKIAKTIATIRIKMPNNGKVRQQTLLLTSPQHSIKSLFDIEAILKKT